MDYKPGDRDLGSGIFLSFPRSLEHSPKIFEIGQFIRVNHRADPSTIPIPCDKIDSPSIDRSILERSNAVRSMDVSSGRTSKKREAYNIDGHIKRYTDLRSGYTSTTSIAEIYVDRDEPER